MTREENIRAILDAHFTGFQDEIKDSAVARIMSLKDESPKDAESHMSISVPVGATNGEIFETLFPSVCASKDDVKGYTVSITQYFSRGGNCWKQLDKDWWDTPYTEVSSEPESGKKVTLTPTDLAILRIFLGEDPCQTACAYSEMEDAEDDCSDCKFKEDERKLYEKLFGKET